MEVNLPGFALSGADARIVPPTVRVKNPTQPSRMFGRLVTRYEFELKDNTTPENLFERRWALTLLDQVLSRLREDYAAAAKLEVFERLQIFLSGDKRLIPYTDVAASLGLSEGVVKVAVHRLRKRYGELLREGIAQTVATPEEIADEMRPLIAGTSR